MTEQHESPFAKLDDPDAPWMKKFKEQLADQLARGGTLYQVRDDGAYVERRMVDGEMVERVIEPARTPAEK